MTDYNLKYKRLKPEVIFAVKETIRRYRFFKQNNFLKLFLLNRLHNNLCLIYGINEEDKPRLVVTVRNDGFYNQRENIIALSKKVSLITFLHEFKHFLQYLNNKPNNEEIARGYSLSLFYKASPKCFNIALRKGLILHQKVKTKIKSN